MDVHEQLENEMVQSLHDQDLYRDLLRLFSQKVYGEDLSIGEMSRRLDTKGDYERTKSVQLDEPIKICYRIYGVGGEPLCAAYAEFDEYEFDVPASHGFAYPRKGEKVRVEIEDRVAQCEVVTHEWWLCKDGDYVSSMRLNIYLNEVPSD